MSSGERAYLTSPNHLVRISCKIRLVGLDNDSELQ